MRHSVTFICWNLFNDSWVFYCLLNQHCVLYLFCFSFFVFRMCERCWIECFRHVLRLHNPQTWRGEKDTIPSNFKQNKPNRIPNRSIVLNRSIFYEYLGVLWKLNSVECHWMPLNVHRYAIHFLVHLCRVLLHWRSTKEFIICMLRVSNYPTGRLMQSLRMCVCVCDRTVDQFRIYHNFRFICRAKPEPRRK